MSQPFNGLLVTEKRQRTNETNAQVLLLRRLSIINGSSTCRIYWNTMYVHRSMRNLVDTTHPYDGNVWCRRYSRRVLFL